MPSGDGRWAELSSQNERVIRPGDPDAGSDRVQARWAELASSGERLVDTVDPQPQAAQRRGVTAMRLVASAA
jgi:hypothetical protein